MSTEAAPRNDLARVALIAGVVAIFLTVVAYTISFLPVFTPAPYFVLFVGATLEWGPALLSVVGVVLASVAIKRGTEIGVALVGLACNAIAFLIPLATLVYIAVLSQGGPLFF